MAETRVTQGVIDVYHLLEDGIDARLAKHVNACADSIINLDTALAPWIASQPYFDPSKVFLSPSSKGTITFDPAPPAYILFPNSLNKYFCDSIKPPPGFTRINNVEIIYYGNYAGKLWVEIEFGSLGYNLLPDVYNTISGNGQTPTLQNNSKFNIYPPNSAWYSTLPLPTSGKDLLYFKLRRDATNILDTYENDLIVVGILITFGN